MCVCFVIPFLLYLFASSINVIVSVHQEKSSGLFQHYLMRGREREREEEGEEGEGEGAGRERRRKKEGK